MLFESIHHEGQGMLDVDDEEMDDVELEVLSDENCLLLRNKCLNDDDEDDYNYDDEMMKRKEREDVLSKTT